MIMMIALPVISRPLTLIPSAQPLASSEFNHPTEDLEDYSSRPLPPLFGSVAPGVPHPNHP